MHITLLLALTLFASATSAATLTINGVPTEGKVVITTGAAPPTPTPVPTPPPPPPPPTACSTGMIGGDRVWSPFNEVQLWPVPPVTGSGAQGRAIKFVADSSRYPRGVELGGVDESQPNKPKDYVVSACPHSFVPVGGNPLCQKLGAGSTMGPISLRFGPAQPRTFFGQPLPTVDCPLTPGGTYYVNFRDATGAGGGVSSQFVINKQTD